MAEFDKRAGREWGVGGGSAAATSSLCDVDGICARERRAAAAAVAGNAQTRIIIRYLSEQRLLRARTHARTDAPHTRPHNVFTFSKLLLFCSKRKPPPLPYKNMFRSPRHRPPGKCAARLELAPSRRAISNGIQTDFNTTNNNNRKNDNLALAPPRSLHNICRDTAAAASDDARRFTLLIKPSHSLTLFYYLLRTIFLIRGTFSISLLVPGIELPAVHLFIFFID